jgi:hypothetical protein
MATRPQSHKEEDWKKTGLGMKELGSVTVIFKFFGSFAAKKDFAT